MGDKYTTKQIRRLLGFSQTEMGEKLGMARNVYANKENGKTAWLSVEVERFLDVTGYRFEQVKF